MRICFESIKVFRAAVEVKGIGYRINNTNLKEQNVWICQARNQGPRD